MPCTNLPLCIQKNNRKYNEILICKVKRKKLTFVALIVEKKTVLCVSRLRFLILLDEKYITAKKDNLLGTETIKWMIGKFFCH